MVFDFKKAFQQKLDDKVHDYAISGMVAQDGTVYPLGSDTKVLSTIFELFTRPFMLEIAAENGLQLIEPIAQNHYPDFTLCSDRGAMGKIAVDVKTTYVTNPSDPFGFTLGGYTSFIRDGNGTKNIAFPFHHYAEHWVVGYVYERIAAKQAAQHATYRLDQLKKIPLAYQGVRVFVQEKWRIASDKAGSGNTTNIGSIRGRIDDFLAGNGPFQSEEEFLHYWKNYGTTAAARLNFKNILGYRDWRVDTAPIVPVQPATPSSHQRELDE